MTTVEVGYTNWCGEFALRRIIPKSLWFGSTEWHPEPQWLIKAIDVDKDAERDFALTGFALPSGNAFQHRVQPWMLACFGEEISKDRIERNHRFIEEALELVQANGCTQSEAHQLVDYVFGRPAGDLHQEIGGVMVTLAALCLAIGEEMHRAGETELARIWTKVDKIRAKQAAKPKHSPLPEVAPSPAESMKIIGVDNLARESVADFLVAEKVPNEYVGKIMVDALNAEQGDHGMTFFQLVPSDYRLSRGMADLV